MISPLVSLVGRWMRGERLEKATPYDYRLWFGILLVLPVFTAVFVRFGRALLDDAQPVYLWFGLMGFGLGAVAAVYTCARFVPAYVSLLLAIVAWIIFYRLMPFAA